jgi:ribosomal protein S18 acetylase RimI-like enzyme
MATSPKNNNLISMSILDQLNVRLATPQDAAKIASFSTAMALETEGRHLDRDDRQLVGQLMITFEWSDWRNGAFWWIQSVYVAPAWRRQSVFRRMHQIVMATAKTNPNVCGIRLYVEENNSVAQAVYRKVGLTPSSYAIFETDFVLARQNGLMDCPTEA